MRAYVLHFLIKFKCRVTIAPIVIFFYDCSFPEKKKSLYLNAILKSKQL